MRMRRWLGLALSALLLFAAGCQAVQGIDLNSVLLQSAKTVSYEGSMVFELDVDLNDKALADLVEEDEGLAALFTHVKLDLDEIKVKDKSNFSVSGTLELGDLGIDFALQTDDKLAVIELEGARAPIVIDLAYLEEEFPELSPQRQREERELSLKHLNTVGDYLIGNMPNVSELSVQLNAPVTVGGEELKLTRVSARLDGAELLEWLKQYLEALSKDEEGIRAFMQAVLEFAEEQAALLGESGLPLDEPLFGEDEIFDLEEAVDDWSDMLKALSMQLTVLEITDSETLEAIFGDDLNISADLYLDGNLDVRRQDIEIEYRPDPALVKASELPDLAELERIRIFMSSETWNINGDVKPAVPRVPEDGGVTIETMEEWTTAETLRFFGPGSDLFELFAVRFGAGSQTMLLFSGFEPGPVKAPNGWTLVPLRHVAEYFEAEIKYDRETGSLIVRDDATGKEIVLTVGSSRVLVNGEPVEWSYPVTMMADGSAYVPARNLIETLGGTLEWDEFFGMQVLVMTRDVGELIRP